jgi:hypothetical protein
MALALLLTCAAGCAGIGSANPGDSQSTMTENTSETDRQHFDAAQDQMEHILPLLQESAATAGVHLPLENLAEVSCLGAIVENIQEQTSWQGFLGEAVPNQAEAQSALDAVAASLETEGWTLGEDSGELVDDPDYGRYLVYRKDGIIINASYRFGDGGLVEIRATTVCVDHPTDHQMVRSTLDPSYGKSSKYYPDGQ